MTRKLIAETFRVYTDDVLAGPAVHKGAAVVSFWNERMPAKFLDFLMDPDSPSMMSTYKANLAYRLDEEDPPEEVSGKVYELGLDPRMFAGGVGVNILAPNIVRSTRGESMGNFALACFIDDLPSSVGQRKAANIFSRGNAKELQSFGTPQRGSSLYLISHGSEVGISDGGHMDVTPHAAYTIRYDKSEGLLISRGEPKRGLNIDFPDFPSGPEDEGGDIGGGSDRVRPKPHLPLHSGAAELEIPREQEREGIERPVVIQLPETS
jgi:hypothetical protein